ncbi:MAG: NAD-dependent epimerase/dehydratase family protein [Bauldia sp.]|nr:NAD-dependent epimerase/dehydratase family protein [Bauldia sp.]
MKNKPSLPVKGNRFLIVGGASLVGTATTEALLAHDPGEVVIFDNFALGSASLLDHLKNDPRVRIVQGDILRLPSLLAATEGIDGVLHLAAMMTISMDRDPWTGLDVNIRGAQNVIEACRANRIRKLVFASSNAVYGYGPEVKGNLDERTPFYSAGAQPAGILYGASKIIGEQLCRDAFRRHELDYVILRYSTVYGERQHYRAANARLIMESYDAIRRGERPRLVGTGDETKHFVYVGDLARANVLAFEADATDVAVNVSGPEIITTRQLVRLVAEVAGSDLEPEFVPPEAGKVLLSAGDAFRIDHDEAGKVIGWRPQTDMKSGIARLISWREEHGG